MLERDQENSSTTKWQFLFPNHHHHPCFPPALEVEALHQRRSCVANDWRRSFRKLSVALPGDTQRELHWDQKTSSSRSFLLLFLLDLLLSNTQKSHRKNQFCEHPESQSRDNHRRRRRRQTQVTRRRRKRSSKKENDVY